MNINIEILTLDYLILVLAAIFIVYGLLKGFVSSVLGLLTWVGSVFITIFTYEYLSLYMTKILLNLNFLRNLEQFVSILSAILSIPIIFLLSLFLLKRLRKLLSNDLDKNTLGLLFDKFLGALYGLIFSYIFYSTILYFTNDNEIVMIKNLHIFIIENSNLLKMISMSNESLINYFYNSN